MEAINKVLYNCDQTADTTAAQKAQARANIGAQAQLTAGDNVTIDANNVVSATVNATAPLYGSGTQADPIRLLVSHGLSLVQPSGGDTALQVTHPVPAPGSTSAGKVLTCDDQLGNLSWQTPAAAPSIVQKQDYGDTSASTVSTLLIDADDPENYTLLKADNVTKGYLVQGPYKTLLDSGVNGVGDTATPVYVDSNGQFATCTVQPGGKRSHTAELYYHHYDDGDHYNVRGVKNYCINHVAITNHSADICYIEVEAPTLGTNEEYDYYVVFDCTNSSGGSNVSVQNCDAEIFHFPFYNPNGPQGQPFVDFQDKTETWVEFTGSPRYHVEVIGNRYTIHRF